MVDAPVYEAVREKEFCEMTTTGFMAQGCHTLQSDYLELMKSCLSDSLHLDRTYRMPVPVKRRKKWKISSLPRSITAWFAKLQGYEVCEIPRHSLDEIKQLRSVGKDWPACAETMIGLKRLTNLQACIEQILNDKVEGDLIETGVWRGGSTIFMRAVLKAYGVQNRRVWVADSFAGLPKPDAEHYPADQGDKHHTFSELAVSLPEVQKNFQKYGLLDEQVQFLKGWFKDTLPTAPIDRISILRLDGDMYESTMDALRALYHKLSPGGFVIVDDYGAIPACAQAIHDFRAKEGITDEIKEIDWTGVYWRKAA